MCYAIPGKVIGIDENIIAVEYFGEYKKARNEFFSLNIGDYVYAQGGFIIQKISEQEALPILDTWKELFFKLQEIDQELTRKPQNIYQKANAIRQKHHGNSCCIHGIIEFSNYCRCDCLYCGIRKTNTQLSRYRMTVEEIVEAADNAVNKLKFKAMVFQSGEDTYYDEEKLLAIVKKAHQNSPCLINLSIGNRPVELYNKLYQAGARGVLLRFETSNPTIYERMKPVEKLSDRINLIKELSKMGYLVMTGFLLGLPGQTKDDIARDIELMGSLGADVFSFGPFIPHPHTPLTNTPTVTVEQVLDAIAQARITSPKANILVNTSFETLDREHAVRLGLMAGANSLMINLTPGEYQKLYDIYPNRAGIDTTTEERIEGIIKLLRSIGRAPVDLGL